MTKNEVINKIIKQANSLNKKVKSFKNEGITDHYDLVQSMFNDKQMQFNESGSITKSKKFYGNQNMLELQRTLNILTKLNNHDVFGTVRKYKKFATEQWTTLQHTVKEILLKKGYSEDDVSLVISSKAFYNSLLIAFKELKKNYGSEQVVEKVYLQYANMSENDIKQAVSDIEYSVTKQRELDEELREYKEYLQWKEEYKRGKR